MTADERERFGLLLDDVRAKCPFLNGGTIEGICYGLAEYVQADLEEYKQTESPHKVVVSLLEGVIASLQAAGFEYYASFK